jgi:hypothetical protein
MTRFVAIASLQRGALKPAQPLDEHNQALACSALSEDGSRAIRVAWERREGLLELVNPRDVVWWEPGFGPNGRRLPTSCGEEVPGVVSKMVKLAGRRA